MTEHIYALLPPPPPLLSRAQRQTLCCSPNFKRLSRETGGEGRDEQRTWQPYADFLVYCSLMALPWGGGVLATDAPAGDFDAMLADVQRYSSLLVRFCCSRQMQC